jgi:hypothetical protein
MRASENMDLLINHTQNHSNCWGSHLEPSPQLPAPGHSPAAHLIAPHPPEQPPEPQNTAAAPRTPVKSGIRTYLVVTCPVAHNASSVDRAGAPCPCSPAALFRLSEVAALAVGRPDHLDVRRPRAPVNRATQPGCDAEQSL